MRRRALLAASQTGGGDAPEFPLYLYFDSCSEWGFTKSCVRNADEISLVLSEYLLKIMEQYGENSILQEATLKSLGIDIYIEDEYVKEIRLWDTAIAFLTNGKYDYSILNSGGLLIWEGEEI